MDHSTHTALSNTELTADILDGAIIYGPRDEKIGSISQVHGAGAAAHVVIDVGGFLGIGAKPVVLPVEDLKFMRDEENNVHGITSWTKDQL